MHPDAEVVRSLAASYPVDPMTADPDDLVALTPAFTAVGGRPVHDPDRRLAR